MADGRKTPPSGGPATGAGRGLRLPSSARADTGANGAAQTSRDGIDVRLLQHLSRPLILEEGGPPRGVRYLLMAISTLVGGFVLWASVTELPESAIAQGQMRPAGTVQVIQHLEGGIVSEILVDEGRVVRTGEVLMRLDPASALSELEQLRAREAALALEIERLQAFVLDREPDFSIGRGHPTLIADQKQILDIQIRARNQQRSVLISRLGQRQAELKSLVEQKRYTRTQVRLIREQVKMRKQLLDKGLVSRTLYLETERALTQALGDMARVTGEQARVRETISEARNSLVELDARLNNEALNTMGGLSSELAQVRESLRKLEDRVKRLAVVAPVQGVVKGLATRTIGAVIAPGQELMQIVPMEDEIVAEVQIKPNDIGHIRVGLPARVKVTTYDVAQFGPVFGTLDHISATTFKDEDGVPFYKGIIKLEHSYVGHDPTRNPILPGMVVDADITTGSKTLMRYLLKPVFRWSDSSFNER